MCSITDAWIRSSGSPLLLIEDDLLTRWGGVEPPRSVTDDSGPTDYDRACENGAGCWSGLRINTHRRAAVLGGGPVDGTWVELSEGGSRTTGPRSIRSRGRQTDGPDALRCP